MRIQYLSDWHREWMDDSALAEPLPIVGDIVVLAGDIVTDTDQLQAVLNNIPESVPVIYVLGNHEYYGWDWALAERAYAAACQARPNVHLLKNDTVTIHGIRFLGTTLWSALAGRLPPDDYRWKVPDYQQILRDDGQPIRPAITQSWHHQAVRFLEQVLAQPFSGPTIVVTHHAPSFLSEHPRWAGSDIRGAFCSALDALIETYQPTAWIHGHVHESNNYCIGATHVVSNPFGIWLSGENPAFDPVATLTLP